MERLERLRVLRPEIEVSSLDRLMRAAARLPAPRDRWIHGDPHPRKFLCREGVIVGLIDWGDMTAGDPATDLASAWMLFATPDALFAGYGTHDDELVTRSAAWAAHFGVLLALIDDDTDHSATGFRTLDRVQAWLV